MLPSTTRLQYAPHITIMRLGAGLVFSTILFVVLGVAIGFRYRVLSLALATLTAVAWGLVGGWYAQLSVGEATIWAMVLAFTLQAAVLGGLAVRVLARR